MPTIVVQLGLATMPFRIELNAAALTSGTTSGTSGSIRQAEELSTTTAPASVNRGARTREAPPPMENKARSSPERSAVAASSTSTSTPRNARTRPTERGEASSRSSSTGNARSSRIARMTDPTCPVAPTTATRIGPFYGSGRTRPDRPGGPGRPSRSSRVGDRSTSPLDLGGPGPTSAQIEGGVEGAHRLLGRLGPHHAGDPDG